ncbi:Uma2 family endonuclease [Sansalvadorimonas verongulae]|uniref:Uma2 family endonuclease n=1 Tax=Sansalvadorimonas verongulae TaxID=2172824 RepID=UPI0018AD2DAF|nr:Uma2 family endonuclease [Sansalvadorimonas verongulae]
MPQAEQLHFMSPDEYLAFEQQADVKHEYVNGLIASMAGASRSHNLLTLAFVTMLRAHLRGTPYQTYASDRKVDASHKGSTVFYYPDIMVACHPLQSGNGQYVEDKPQIIVEVLSPSTEARDRMEKLSAYTSIPGLKEYVLVSQNKLAIDVYRHSGKGWEIVRYRDNDAISLNSIAFSASLKDVYEDILDDVIRNA